MANNAPKRDYPLLYTPRPLSTFPGASVAPGLDARWRGVPHKVRSINRLSVIEAQQRARRPS